jgi:hypothetical protein
VYRILAALGLVGGPALIAGYAMAPKPGSQMLAVVGVVLVVVGVLSLMVLRDAAKARRSTR